MAEGVGGGSKTKNRAGEIPKLADPNGRGGVVLLGESEFIWVVGVFHYQRGCRGGAMKAVLAVSCTSL